jgi:hypothetical protein
MMRFAAPLLLASALLLLVAPIGVHAQVPAGAPPAAANGPTVRNLVFLIRGPDGVVSAIRTTSFQQQGAVLLLVNAKGGRAMVQARTVAGQLAWLTDEQLAVANTIDIGVLATQYELAARNMPSVKKMLGEEAARLRAEQKRRADALAAEKSAAESRIQAATSSVYDPGAGYTAEALDGLLAAAEAVRAENPAAAPRIDAWGKPFRAHLERLKAGDVYENGAWITKEQVAERARTEREAAFQRSLADLTISAVALPADAIQGLARNAAISAGVAMLVGIGLIVFARRRIAMRAVGVALLVGGPGYPAALFFLATRTPSGLPTESTPADLQPVLLALEAAADPATPADSQTLSEAAVNTFLARFLRIERAANPTGWAATREAIAVRLLPDRLFLFELLRSTDREWIVRYTLDFRPPGVTPPLVVSSVTLGALDLPTGIAQALWRNLEPQLAGLLSRVHVTGGLKIQNPTDGAIKLEPQTLKPDASAPLVIPPPSFNENSPGQSPTPERKEESTASPTPMP